jgi:hypothetical protein
MDWLKLIGRYTLWLLATRTIPWSSFKRSLRPGQVAVPTRGRGTVFCDRETERMAFGEGP